MSLAMVVEQYGQAAGDVLHSLAVDDELVERDWQATPPPAAVPAQDGAATLMGLMGSPAGAFIAEDAE